VGQKVLLRQAPPLLAAGLLSLLPLYFFLLMGDLAWSLKERAVQEVVKAQLREFSQNPVLLNVLFGALPAMLSLLFGPLVGAWSDRTRTRLGRRIPFLLCGAPLLSGALVGLAYSETLADAVVAWFGIDPAFRRETVIACMGAFWALFELLSITSNALFIALVNDTVPKPMLGRFFGLFRIVSLAVGAAFFYVVFGNDLPSVARQVMLAIAAVYLGGFALLCACVREPECPPPSALAAPPGLGRLRAPGGEAPWFYVLLFAALGMATTSLLPVNINSYNAISQFGVDRSSFGHAVALTYCISIVLALPLGWLADRVHPLRVGFAALTLYALCMLGAWFLVVGRTSFLIWFVVHGVLAGAFLTGTAALLPSLLPRARFSELAAFSASVTALLAMVFTLAMGAALDWSGRDFRLMFLAAGLVALAGAGLWYGVLRLFRRAGFTSPSQDR
jgi:MFS family permease